MKFPDDDDEIEPDLIQILEGLLDENPNNRLTIVQLRVINIIIRLEK